MFVSCSSSWKCFVHVYVNNMVIISKNASRFKTIISSKYAMEDLGQVSLRLGMKITHSRGKITLPQQAYSNRLLKEYNLNNSRPTPTPMVPTTCLLPATQADCDKFIKMKIYYQHVIGSINYLTVSTRPDIAFAVSQLSQHRENTGAAHWNAFIHLLQYIKGTQN